MKNNIAEKINSPAHLLREFARFLAALAVLATLTYAGFILHAESLIVGFLYLTMVAMVALYCGFWQATTISVLAVAMLDYFFLAPLFSFNVSNAQDYVALAEFEAIAIIISRLNARGISSSAEASIHRAAMEQLYEISRTSLLMDMRQAPGAQLTILIQRIFGVRAVALYDLNMGRQDRTGEWDSSHDKIAKECFLRGASQDDPETQISQRVLVAGSRPVGALVVHGEMSPLVVDALASLAAIAFDRHQSFEKEERAEDANKSEQLRTAVMDALAHELKTPLTAVKTASAGLLEIGGLTDLQSELITLIDSQAMRLNELCTRLLLTAKLEGKKMGLHTENVNVQDLIAQVLSDQLNVADRARIHVEIADSALTIQVDRELLAMIVTQYIDNARKYSTPNTPIDLEARSSQEEVLISVHNYGSTIRIEDRERVFDRFYRSPDQALRVAGTGIGLSVVRKAAEAHHGHVWVISDAKEGTTFYLSLPINSRRSNE